MRVGRDYNDPYAALLSGIEGASRTGKVANIWQPRRAVKVDTLTDRGWVAAEQHVLDLIGKITINRTRLLVKPSRETRVLEYCNCA